MEALEIRQKIKQIISNITNIPAADIADDASFVDDLALDSLSLLEIGVDVDYEFKLEVGEERLQTIRTMKDAVTLVLERLEERAKTAVVA